MAGLLNWRKAPPAPFPSVLGMSGLALAWVAAARVLGAPEIVGLAFGLVAIGSFVVLTGAYLAKVLTRPMAVVDDLASPVGRGAIPAMSMAMMAIAAWLAMVIGPFGWVGVVWFCAIGLHVLIMCLTVQALRRSPSEERRVTPAMLLPFCGYLVGPAGGVALGYPMISAAIYASSVPPLLFIAAKTAPGILRGAPPPPARPVSAILLAPTALVASGAALFEIWWLAYGVFALSLLTAVFLLAAGAVADCGWVEPALERVYLSFRRLCRALHCDGGAGRRDPGSSCLGRADFGDGDRGADLGADHPRLGDGSVVTVWGI